jgi:sulfide:quinone oxidoreductase
LAHSVLILGGGVGGVVAANRLRRLLPKGDRVIVAERHASASFGASLPWLVVGQRSKETIARPLR